MRERLWLTWALSGLSIKNPAYGINLYNKDCDVLDISEFMKRVEDSHTVTRQNLNV